METLITDVNWLAVVAGAVLAFMAGWLWYSDLLYGQKWRDGIGIAPDDQTSMMPAMISQIVGTLMMAWVVGITATTNSLGFAMLIGLTFAVLVKTNGLFTQKSKYAIAVESGYIILMVGIMIMVHSIL